MILELTHDEAIALRDAAKAWMEMDQWSRNVPTDALRSAIAVLDHEIAARARLLAMCKEAMNEGKG